MASSGRDIEIIIDIDDPLEKKFKALPNVLPRGEYDPELGLDYRGLSMPARTMLAALLTMSSGHKTNRRRIEAIAWDLGDKALDAVLWALRERGHLRIVQTNGAGGRFAYQWGVSMRGRADWAVAEVEARTQRRQRAGTNVVPISAGQTMPPSGGHGDSDNYENYDGDVSAGQTMPPSPGHGGPEHGAPSPGGPRDGANGTGKKDQALEEPEREKPPTPPGPADSPASPSANAEGGEGISQDQKAMAEHILDDVLHGAPLARQPRGKGRATLTEDIATKLAAGWPQNALTDEISGSFVGADSIRKVLAARIRRVGAPPPPPPPHHGPGELAGKPKDDGLSERLLAEGRLDQDQAKAAARAAAAEALARAKAS